MSKYTTEVRFICETEAGYDESKGYNNVDSILNVACPKIFSFNFPIFDESYRLPLEKKILKHFYTREICEETYGLWKLRLDAKMNEIMPYYNKLYESELLKFNPLYDVDLTTQHDKEGVETGVENATENEANNRVKSESSVGRSNENNDEAEHRNNVFEKTGSESDTKSATGKDKNNNDETITSGGNKVTSKGTTNKGSSNTDDLKWEAYSDTPQGDLRNVETLNYLTNATKNTDLENVKTENVENSNIVETGDETTTRVVGNDRLQFSNENGFRENEEKEKGNEDRTRVNYNERDYNENKNGNETGERDRKMGKNKTINNVEDYFQHIVGKRGSMTYSKMLNEFRDTFLNIDMMIINDMQDLFFLLW